MQCTYYIHIYAMHNFMNIIVEHDRRSVDFCMIHSSAQKAPAPARPHTSTPPPPRDERSIARDER